MSTLNGLKKRLHKLLVDYSKTEKEARTPITRDLAESIVESRSHFVDADGNVDWRGKTYPYRTWIREIFAEANLRGDDANRVQSAIRYHVSEVLRRRLDEETLEDIGLIPQTARERSAERRHERSALLNALNARDAAGGALLALTALHGIVQRINSDEVAGLSGSEREVAEATLKDLERRVKALRRALK